MGDALGDEDERAQEAPASEGAEQLAEAPVDAVPLFVTSTVMVPVPPCPIVKPEQVAESPATVHGVPFSDTDVRDRDGSGVLVDVTVIGPEETVRVATA